MGSSNQTTTNWLSPVRTATISTNRNYEVSDGFVNQVIASGACNPADPDAPAITVTLPDSVEIGRTIRLVAAFAAINVDGNGNNIAGDNTFVPQGRAASYTFVGQTNTNCDCCCNDCTKCDSCNCDAGTWVPDCCAETPVVPQ